MFCTVGVRTISYTTVCPLSSKEKHVRAVLRTTTKVLLSVVRNKGTVGNDEIQKMSAPNKQRSHEKRNVTLLDNLLCIDIYYNTTYYY
jgi:hypothetical protein